LVMPESPELPPDTLVVCPQCGTKNTRTDMQCRKCDADLTTAKQSIVAKLGLSPKPQTQMPISFEQQVLAKLDRIEGKANENQGFMIILLVVSFIMLLMLIF
jgi:uncharacterized membrane protein YvbJ